MGLGARESDITVIKDCNYNKFAELFREIAVGVTRNWQRRQEKTFIFIYFLGYGVM